MPEHFKTGKPTDFSFLCCSYTKELSSRPGEIWAGDTCNQKSDTKIKET